MQSNQQPALAVYANLGKDQRFGTQDRMFRDLAQLAKQKQLDFFILVPGFSQTMATGIDGYRWTEENGRQNGWEKTKVIWPPVVLRRLVHYPSSVKNWVHEEESLLETQTRLITLPRRMGNKWSAYQHLRKDISLRPYLPKTTVMKSPSDLFPYLETMTDLYIKPMLGSQGSRVMRIQKGDGDFSLAASQVETVHFSYQDVPELLLEVDHRLSGHAAIVQETIPLMRTYGGEPVDLRYLVQSLPGKERPFVVPIARVGKKKNVTTNLHTGGQAFSSKKLAELLPDEQVNSWQQGVEQGKKVARKVFQSFQKEYPSLFELGIDLAIDQSGRVYWLEVNPCPGRRMLKAVSEDWRVKSLERIVEYAKHLLTGEFKNGL